MPCRKGSVNYKNQLLIPIVSELLSNGDFGWQAVAVAYQEKNKEEFLRESADLKKHWVRILCNGMKKPTGKQGAPGDRIHQCIAIEREKLDKTHSGMVGLSSSDNVLSGSEESEGGEEVVEGTP